MAVFSRMHFLELIFYWVLFYKINDQLVSCSQATGHLYRRPLQQNICSETIGLVKDHANIIETIQLYMRCEIVI